MQYFAQIVSPLRTYPIRYFEALGYSDLAYGELLINLNRDNTSGLWVGWRSDRRGPAPDLTLVLADGTSAGECIRRINEATSGVVVLVGDPVVPLGLPTLPHKFPPEALDRILASTRSTRANPEDLAPTPHADRANWLETSW